MLKKFFILMLFFSFKTFAQTAEKKDFSDYFPMGIGYMWFYNSYATKATFDSTTYDETHEIKDTLTMYNKIFYLFEYVFYNPDRTIRWIDTLFFAFQKDTLFEIYNHRKSEPVPGIALVFSEKRDKRFVLYKVLYDNDAEIYKGYLYDYTDSTYTFDFFIENSMDSGWQTTFKKDIGMIESHSYSTASGSKLIKFLKRK